MQIKFSPNEHICWTFNLHQRTRKIAKMFTNLHSKLVLSRTIAQSYGCIVYKFQKCFGQCLKTLHMKRETVSLIGRCHSRSVVQMVCDSLFLASTCLYHSKSRHSMLQLTSIPERNKSFSENIHFVDIKEVLLCVQETHQYPSNE